MKKLFLSILIIPLFLGAPVLAATAATSVKAKPQAPKVKVTVTPAKPVWSPDLPEGYAPITWAKAPGIASFFKAPSGNGSIDFITRIYLPQNQIGFITATSTPLDLGPANPNFISTTSIDINTEATTTNGFRNLSFERVGAETAKKLSPDIKFIWDAAFFNMKTGFSDLSLALKYSVGTTTITTSGSRSIPDMEEERRMLIINNQSGKATVSNFDANVFVDNKSGDQALEGFSPTVAKTDGSSPAAARLFLGVANDGQELVVYCSNQATVQEASLALSAAGVLPEHQLEADGGGSTACGYNLPGQFFVEPKRSLPVLMGALTILNRGQVINDTLNVRGGASTKDSIVATLSKGTLIRIFEEKNGWVRIGDGQWVLKALIKIL